MIDRIANMATPAGEPTLQDRQEAGGSGAQLLRELLWRRLDVPGIEYFRLWESARGPRLAGTVIFSHDGSPVRLKYGIACAPDWTTRGVHVVLTRGAVTRHLKLVVDERRRWWHGAEEIAAVAGCLDVDLAFTPATNLLPLRRLGLGVGEGRDLTAAWVRFPGLDVEPLAQRYTRLADDRLRYESRGGAFTADLELDDLGLVVRYPPLWEQVGSH
jgi:hypothetical protein